MPDNSPSLMISSEGEDEVSLLDILDHVLNAGVVIQGTVVISLAGVDLIYVGLNVIVTSVETALRHMPGSMLRGDFENG
jgi:hypothetical protein